MASQLWSIVLFCLSLSSCSFASRNRSSLRPTNNLTQFSNDDPKSCIMPPNLSLVCVGQVSDSHLLMITLEFNMINLSMCSSVSSRNESLSTNSTADKLNSNITSSCAVAMKSSMPQLYRHVLTQNRNLTKSSVRMNYTGVIVHDSAKGVHLLLYNRASFDGLVLYDLKRDIGYNNTALVLEEHVLLISSYEEMHCYSIRVNHSTGDWLISKMKFNGGHSLNESHSIVSVSSAYYPMCSVNSSGRVDIFVHEHADGRCDQRLQWPMARFRGFVGSDQRFHLFGGQYVLTFDELVYSKRGMVAKVRNTTIEGYFRCENVDDEMEIIIRNTVISSVTTILFVLICILCCLVCCCSSGLNDRQRELEAKRQKSNQSYFEHLQSKAKAQINSREAYPKLSWIKSKTTQKLKKKSSSNKHKSKRTISKEKQQASSAGLFNTSKNVFSGIATKVHGKTLLSKIVAKTKSNTRS